MTALAGALLALCVLLPSGGVSTTGTVPNHDAVAAHSLEGDGDVSGGPLVGLNDGSVKAVLPETSTSVSGRASWYCDPPRYPRCTRGVPEGSMAAAAGPALRVGDWRGRTVTVCSPNCEPGNPRVNVVLRDWCRCPDKVVDLYRAAFSRLGNPSRGILRVEVTWGDGPVGTLPPTSTSEETP